MIHFVVEPHRNFGFRYFIADRGGDRDDRFHLLDPELLQRDCRFAPGSYVFTLDDLLPAEVEAYEAVWNQLGQHAPGVRLLNHPRNTMGRHALLQTLYNSGRSRVRAVRTTEPLESLRYPVFVREEVRHTGSLTPLIDSPDEVRRTLRNLALRGFRREELLVVEFCDTSDSEGVIRKYSAYIVGDRVIPRALEFGTNWTVKHDPHSYTPERIIEEREFVESNPHEAQLRDIFSLAKVQYGRIDYAMIDGALQVWEINLNPTIGRNRPETEESAEVLRIRGLRRPTGDIFYSRFLAAWDALDAPTAIGEPVCIEVDPRLWKAAHRARAAALRGARYQRAMQWATHQPTLGATWQLLKRLRPPVRSQLTDDQTEGS
ncbi:MAG: hypothetical protein SFU57_05745 [Gemmatimonadales bacterium]|nr:hypothetical protein [Gemmatimonadales bacterium]